MVGKAEPHGQGGIGIGRLAIAHLRTAAQGDNPATVGAPDFAESQSGLHLRGLR
jgi:hypothetical protein